MKKFLFLGLLVCGGMTAWGMDDQPEASSSEANSQAKPAPNTVDIKGIEKVKLVRALWDRAPISKCTQGPGDGEQLYDGQAEKASEGFINYLNYRKLSIDVSGDTTNTCFYNKIYGQEAAEIVIHRLRTPTIKPSIVEEEQEQIDPAFDDICAKLLKFLQQDTAKSITLDWNDSNITIDENEMESAGNGWSCTSPAPAILREDYKLSDNDHPIIKQLIYRLAKPATTEAEDSK